MGSKMRRKMFISNTGYVTGSTVIKYEMSTAEPGYNDIGLCQRSSITLHILWH